MSEPIPFIQKYPNSIVASIDKSLESAQGYMLNGMTTNAYSKINIARAQNTVAAIAVERLLLYAELYRDNLLHEIQHSEIKQNIESAKKEVDEINILLDEMRNYI